MSANPKLIYQLDSGLLQNYLLVAPFALYAYDRLLMFDREVDLMWRRPTRRKVPIVPILYGLMHVSTPLYFLINVATWWDLDCKRFVGVDLSRHRLTDDRCSVYGLNLAYGADICILYLAWGVISALRVYAINPRDWVIPSMIFILSLAPVATNLHRNILMVWEVLPPSYTCTITNNVPERVQSIAVAVDALVLLATWRVTYGVKRMSQLVRSDVSVTLLLLRDGTLYFGCNCPSAEPFTCFLAQHFPLASVLNSSLLALNVFSAVCWAKIPAIQDFDNFIYSFTTLLLSRLFFNLREVSLLQSTLQADAENVSGTDVRSLAWEPAERTQTFEDSSELGPWSRSTTLGTLGGSLVSAEGSSRNKWDGRLSPRDDVQDPAIELHSPSTTISGQRAGVSA
ncbi:hypothetical protein DAEQUDRAFT_761641 [Daedalea quercina L-15889]|uniref:DUF6533 domain-containing protein n=1 Tax=Daedalea quercina L-15889 TaxID=1314783 RepID=A0A165U0E4_9APHY|nr:hypothetical protein DAEQUDRAFT_761641 [Daedalea quercina L-15889]